jgi:rhodanese-related sulfurtransferase
MKIKTNLFSVCILAALFSNPLRTFAADADGNWIWTTPGRNGAAARESVLSLKTEGAQLTGKLSTPGRDGKPTSIPIENGKTDGSQISFEIVRVANGATNVTRYEGVALSNQITGKIETGREGETQSRSWNARNAGSQTEAASVVIVPPKPGYDANGHKIVNETHFKDISVTETVEFLTQHPDAIILDTRTPREFNAGHLPNARNYDLTDDATYQTILATITDKTKWYVVHSQVGHYRTVRALEYFQANGFEHAVAIDGGYQAWVKAGKPVVKEAQQQAKQ